MTNPQSESESPLKSAGVKTEGLDSWVSEALNNYHESLIYAAKLHCMGLPRDNGDLDIAEGLRSTMRFATCAELMMLEANPAHPVLVKQQSVIRQLVLPATDAVYYTAPIHGDFTYRLHGNRGSAHIFQVTVYSGNGNDLQTYRSFSARDNFDNSAWGQNADVDIVLSKDKHDGDWIPIPEGPCDLMVRQYFVDWEECPHALVFERIGGKFSPPPPTKEEIIGRMEATGNYLRQLSNYTRTKIQMHLDTDPNKVTAANADAASFQGVAYLSGHYRCQPNEAIILEVKPPACKYWMFQLSNVGGWEALEYHMRQVSLNMRQASLDDDGVFRAVISQYDPGVANWLDTSGRTLGLIDGRYYRAESLPEPSLTKVPFESVSAYLPKSTPRVTPEQRQERLRSRMLSVYKRMMVE